MGDILSSFSSMQSILLAILVFCVLVVSHEFGHFIIAKKNDILVEEFAVGMGPKLFSKKLGETVYSLRLFPIGGFCRMLGEDEDSLDPRAFNNKSVPARMSVIFAGPAMNFLLAFFLILCITLTTGFMIPKATKILDNYDAKTAGMEVGDIVKSVNGERIVLFEDLMVIMGKSDGSPLDVEVERNGKSLVLSITPTYVKETGEWILGYTPDAKTGMLAEKIEGFKSAGLFETIKVSFFSMIFYIKHTVSGFIELFSMKLSPDEISGPIGIVQIIGESYQTGLKTSVASAFKNLAFLAAVLSANLGALNLFPIPALDGSRLVFLIIEGIRKKPISPEREGFIHFAGFILLMAFMAVIAYNDIARIFF